MMDNRYCQNDCSGCCGACGSCGACGGGICRRVPFLTSDEAAMLRLFAEIPFLPVARREGSPDPIFREETGRTEEEAGPILTGLCEKGLISLDYDLPLQGFDYAAYAACPIRGSMALTALGQDTVELLDVQGAVE